MNRPLVVTGAVLVILGAILFFYVMFVTSSPVDDLGPLAATPEPALFGDPSRLWGLLAGLSVAAGLAMVGIGMNRWRQRGA